MVCNVNIKIFVKFTWEQVLQRDDLYYTWINLDTLKVALFKF